MRCTTWIVVNWRFPHFIPKTRAKWRSRWRIDLMHDAKWSYMSPIFKRHSCNRPIASQFTRYNIRYLAKPCMPLAHLIFSAFFLRLMRIKTLNKSTSLSFRSNNLLHCRCALLSQIKFLRKLIMCLFIICSLCCNHYAGLFGQHVPTPEVDGPSTSV